MALGKLPYRPQISGRTTDANGVAVITFEVRDADNALRTTLTMNDDGYTPIPQQLEQAIAVYQEGEAGGKGALLDAVIAGYSTKQWVSADPAYVPDALTLNGVAPATWTNQPAALTALPGATTRTDMGRTTEARLVATVNTAGFAGSKLRVQYSSDGGSTWRGLDGTATSAEIPITVGTQASPWVILEDAARADVLIRLVGEGGNNTADPQFGLTILERR